METKHNEKKWAVRTNRHCTTNGYNWGWIEGAPGNVCWSDDPCNANLTRAKAYEVVEEHNAMLRINVILDEETRVSLDYMPEVGEHVIAIINDENGMPTEVSGFVTEIL